ncbi:hypothetical protein Tcan_01846 [Toxocara canis]|uniref:Uncharacterized protein n=1 Tax=Toxocara canis TaxID=6265 RepID=A0A0B2UU02_TOXCA|nr:hypothetical protein Tcan_01846 [Toxocara canis]
MLHIIRETCGPASMRSPVQHCVGVDQWRQPTTTRAFNGLHEYNSYSQTAIAPPSHNPTPLTTTNLCGFLRTIQSQRLSPLYSTHSFL